jgi:hypothetical protein
MVSKCLHGQYDGSVQYGGQAELYLGPSTAFNSPIREADASVGDNQAKLRIEARYCSLFEFERVVVQTDN